MGLWSYRSVMATWRPAMVSRLACLARVNRTGRKAGGACVEPHRGEGSMAKPISRPNRWDDAENRRKGGLRPYRRRGGAIATRRSHV
jgi:hypothetical protein